MNLLPPNLKQSPDRPLLQKAWDFAEEKHKAQKDDSGGPYFYHCVQVCLVLQCVAASDENLLCAGLLHDTIEDTDTTYEELKREFNKDVADLVMEVTHEGDKDRGYHFPRLKTQRGIMLKFADRLSNLSRMEPWDEKRKAHYIKKSTFWKSGTPNVEMEVVPGWRKGQTIFNFLEYLKGEGHPTKQSDRMADPFHIPNKELDRLYADFINQNL